MASLRLVYIGFLNLCGLIAGVVIALIAVLVSLDVVLRNLRLGNFPWLIEVTEYALYGITFLAAPWVLHLGAHVRVDILIEALPQKAATVLECLMDMLGLGLSLVLIYYGVIATLDAWTLGSLIFKELIIPEWQLLWVIPFSGGLLALEFMLRILRALRVISV